MNPSERQRLDTECDAARAELQSYFHPDEVPAELAELNGWALMLGVGDEVCRAHFVARLSPDEAHAAAALIDAHALALQQWLNSFGDQPLSDEATALMYLALAVEELRG